MSIDRWMDKEEVVYIYNSILLSRKKELKVPFAATLMDLEIIVLSRVSQPCTCAQSLSCVRLFATPWTVACQPPLSTGFSRQEYWSGLPCPSTGDLPNPETQPVSRVSCTGRQVLYHWATWVAQSKSDTERQISCDITNMYDFLNDTSELIYKK